MVVGEEYNDILDNDQLQIYERKGIWRKETLNDI